MHKVGKKCSLEKEVVYYHKSKRVGNAFVFQKLVPEHFTTHSFDEAKKEKNDEAKIAKYDRYNRLGEGVNIGGNNI
jgi:hypothetical protein